MILNGGKASPVKFFYPLNQNIIDSQKGCDRDSSYWLPLPQPLLGTGKMKLSEKIKAIRIAEGLSQNQLCELIDLPRSTLSKYESGM